jgi:hypothetical protein
MADIEKENKSWLHSDSVIKRSFSIWLHYSLAQFLILLTFVFIYVVMAALLTP